MNHEISVIVPAFNEEKNIAKCLNSILNQNFQDFEIICIDDNSTDSTFSIMQKFAERDPRVKPFKNSGKGVAAARNFGIDMSCGNYISFVDSDDSIQPQMLEFLYKAASENNADMSVCDYRTTDGSDDIIENFSYKAQECDCDYLVKNGKISSLVTVWSKLVKKDLVKGKIKFRDFRIGEDAIVSSELWVTANKVYFCDLPLYNYYFNPNSVTHTGLDDTKWLERIESHLISYKIFSPYDKDSTSVWFLETGMKDLLSFMLHATKNNKSEIKRIYKELFCCYCRDENIPFANKIYVFLSYHLPKLYILRRKFYDKTLR